MMSMLKITAMRMTWGMERFMMRFMMSLIMDNNMIVVMAQVMPIMTERIIILMM